MNTLLESRTAVPQAGDLEPIDAVAVATSLDSAPANLVAQAALDLADAPRFEYNPLLFFGPSGTGKTSLLREFSQRWSARAPADQVHFCTAADFARSYAHAVETDGLSDFRQRRLSCPLLLIDNLSELAGKQAAQRELLRLIELRSDRWLVLAAEAALVDLPLIPQLTGRLSSGLAVALVHPDRARRQLLVQELCTAYEIELVPSAVSELASRCRTHRQLEHHVRQLAATGPHAEAIGFEQVLDTLAATMPRPDVRAIVSAVAVQSKVSVRAMRGSSRRRHVVRARGIAMFLVRHNTRLSLQKIGCYFGKRDHSTVLHAIGQAELLVAQEPLLHRQLVGLGLLSADDPAVDNPSADVTLVVSGQRVPNSLRQRPKNSAPKTQCPDNLQTRYQQVVHDM
ncbi:MAG: DnaA/Hda family protein [Planctomycetota bacterium]|nr:DnaA/Hda family protein [Planctomycetota bacterium]